MFVLLKTYYDFMQMVLWHVNGLTCDGCFHEGGLSLKVLCMCIEFGAINYVHEMLFYMMH